MRRSAGTVCSCSIFQLSFVLARVHPSVVATALFILELEAALGQQGTASRYLPVTGRTSDLVYIDQATGWRANTQYDQHREASR